MAFVKGKRHPKQGGRENGLKGGRPTKADLEARAAMLTVWEREIKKREAALARRYVKRAFQSDRVLLDVRRARLPDAKQGLDLTVHGKVEIFTNVQPDLGPQRR